MKLNKSTAEYFVFDNAPLDKAIGRTTHMAVAAHQDDTEIMAYDGIQKCFGKEDLWFTAVVVTNGAGSPRNGIYQKYTDEDMKRIRKMEQKKAAFVGEYGFLAMLDYESAEVKDKHNREPVEDLKQIISMARPKVIYTHNLADKHSTHVAVALKLISALRELPEEIRPEKLYGCEVWGKLDWVKDDEKVVFNVSDHPNIAQSLLGVFDSQICGGKRYDQAALGNRQSNATFLSAYNVDVYSSAILGMDLTPLIRNENMDIAEYIKGYIDRFSEEVSEKINKMI
ncbi:PIG-L deacetylase family protein [Acetivibrio clariflavus]|uniref:Putative LmbE-like protein n=1 Tax=Acetivibrio clariflavus (strain DSM 19732 / NBRC 101661 / EBR45) TaxID=720554 RepID=G8M0L7_ACECE|nr:PIG-L family deacetylase [Acetivibrio clariflavus]AEV69098.1 putative LmbE-like protein [Acetivibrio clariflavus DSM 19732]